MSLTDAELDRAATLVGTVFLNAIATSTMMGHENITNTLRDYVHSDDEVVRLVKDAILEGNERVGHTALIEQWQRRLVSQ